MHCLLALGQGQNDGVLIESEGYSFARYAAYLPGMRHIVNARLEQAADFIVQQGTGSMQNGIWRVSFEELEKQLGLTIREGNGLDSMLLDTLRRRTEVAAVETHTGYIEIEYHPEYCQQISRGSENEIPGIRLKELLPLLRSGMVVPSHEAAEMMVLAENPSMLTEAGQQDYIALLNARVTAIGESPGGTEVTLADVAPAELVRFREAYDAFMEAEQDMGPVM